MQPKQQVKKCLSCSMAFLGHEKRRFCSHRCYSLSLRGRSSSRKGEKNSPEHNLKNSLSHLGQKAWNKGLVGIYSSETLKKMSAAQQGKKGNLGKKIPLLSGVHHYAWKGEKVSYRALHHWVQRAKGKPMTCSFCSREVLGKGIHWANKSHEYNRDLTDWIRLCARCHKQYDMKKTTV